MGYVLRQGVSYVILGRNVVFLDANANRYFLGARAAGEALRHLSKDPNASAADAASLTPLLEAGLLKEIAARSSIPPAASIGSGSSILDGEPSPVWCYDLASALYDSVRYDRALKRRTLRDVLSQRAMVDGERIRGAARDDAETSRSIAFAYQRAGLILPTMDRCLPRSIALASTLGRRGIPCDLVFGVALGPFSAHCWVQKDGVVLNDSLDHVRNFAPILIL